MILNKDSKVKTRIFTNTVQLIFKHFITLIIGQGIFIGISMFVLTTFVTSIFKVALSTSGYSYITVNNIGQFLSNPMTILVLITLFIVIGVFLLFITLYFLTFFSTIENGNTPKLFTVYLLSFKRLILIFLNRNVSLIPMVWLAVVLSNLPLIYVLLKRVNLFRYLTETIVDNQIVLIFMILVPIVFAIVMLKRLFVFQYCLIEGKKYKEACKLSENIKKNNKLRTAIYALVWNVGIALLVYILYFLIMIITALVVIVITDKELVIATFIALNERMSGFLLIGIFVICSVANFALFTHLFYEYKKEVNEYFYFDNKVEDVFLKVKPNKKIVVIVLVSLVLLNVLIFRDIIRNGSPFEYVNLDRIKITSHRGFSHDVPENTIPAIEKAIEEHADYVEIDVRQTKDGELVLLHDENLLRTTGVNKKVWDLNYAEIYVLDAGKWLDKAYIDTKVPTLREVIEICKGKVELNIDLKYSAKSIGIEDKVVALIDEYDMERQCVISCTNLSILENIKVLNPEIKTGYIAYQIDTHFYVNENIDFFSVNSYFVSETLVKYAHMNGKGIHVWTVDSKKLLEKMKRLGVDNIITNNPAHAREILYQEETNRALIDLLKIMIQY